MAQMRAGHDAVLAAIDAIVFAERSRAYPGFGFEMRLALASMYSFAKRFDEIGRMRKTNHLSPLDYLWC